MRTNRIFLIAAISILSLSSFGQNVATVKSDIAAELRIRKQMLALDLENRIRELDLSAPRVMARYKLAAWLWKDGKDDIGRAEEFAVLAVEDLFKHRVEIPPVYFSALSADLFALLDRNAPNVSKTLRKKYNLDAMQETSVELSMLNQPNGERIAVDSAIRSIYSNDSIEAGIFPLISTLQNRRSRELIRLLEALVNAEENVRGRLSPWTMSQLSASYDSQNISAGLSRRFVTIVLDRSRAASQLQTGPFEAWLDLLTRNLALIERRFSEMTPDANVVRSVLLSRISRQSREANERNERINNSADKLSALISEAEKAEDPSLAHELYWRAARLALEQGKFRKSSELVQLIRDVDMSASLLGKEIRINVENQFLATVAERSIKADDPDAAAFSLDKMNDPVRKSEGFGKLAKYFVEKSDSDSARGAVQQSLRFAANVEDLARRASLYLGLLPVVHSIDPTSIYEINSLAAKSINSIPSLNVEDKPETENYQNHITKLMIVNWNLVPSLSDLVKRDRNGASDLASRIEKKEVRIIADYILGIYNTENPPKVEDPETAIK